MSLSGAASCPNGTGYSMRRPEIARAMTSCWISLVPSKIVWLTLPGLSGAVLCRPMPLTRRDVPALFSG
jgi:hypothetical protein